MSCAGPCRARLLCTSRSILQDVTSKEVSHQRQSKECACQPASATFGAQALRTFALCGASGASTRLQTSAATHKADNSLRGRQPANIAKQCEPPALSKEPSGADWAPAGWGDLQTCSGKRRLLFWSPARGPLLYKPAPACAQSALPAHSTPMQAGGHPTCRGVRAWHRRFSRRRIYRVC